MESSNEYDTTATVKIDDKITEAFYQQYNGNLNWWNPTPLLQDLEMNTVSNGKHQLSLEFKENPSRCKPLAVRALADDAEWDTTYNYVDFITDFQFQGNKMQGAFEVPKGLGKKYTKLVFEMEVFWHRHKKDVCYFASGLYYFGVELV